MPPRSRGQFSDDPYYQIWHDVTVTDPWRSERGHPPATGFYEHRELIDMYAYDLDLDERQKRQFWADYNLYMVSHRTNYRRNSSDNPFWRTWGINPDRDFDWHAWREAMGYPHGGRR